MLGVTLDQLRKAAPRGDLNVMGAIAATSGAVFAKYGITSIERAWGFLSTALEESGFNTLFENLTYSAERAHEVYPGIFPTVASAEPYTFKPQAFANKVTADGSGTQSRTTGGYFEDRGLIQITGRSNFNLLQTLTGLPTVEQPALVTEPGTMLECSVALFSQYPSILKFCDDKNWSAVWALVGTGRATGRVINLANHQAALATVQKAIPALVDVPSPVAVTNPGAGRVATAAPGSSQTVATQQPKGNTTMNPFSFLTTFLPILQAAETIVPEAIAEFQALIASPVVQDLEKLLGKHVTSTTTTTGQTTVIEPTTTKAA